MSKYKKEKRSIFIIYLLRFCVIVLLVLILGILINYRQKYRNEIVSIESYEAVITEKYKAIGVLDTIDYAINFKIKGHSSDTVMLIDKNIWDTIEKCKTYNFTIKYTRAQDKILEVEEINQLE